MSRRTNETVLSLVHSETVQA